MDEELKKLVGTEVSEEFLIENKIETIEQYRNFVQNHMTNEKDKKNKNIKYKKEVAISSTKAKQMKRKNETLLNKKIKNQQREKILKSLQNHNNQEDRKIVDLLESSKNLGKKRKMSNDKNIKRIAKEEEFESEENEKNSASSSDFSDSDLDEDTRRNKLNLSLNEMYSKNDLVNKLTGKLDSSMNYIKDKDNCINTKKSLMDISSEEKNKILSEIKQYRLREEEIEKLEELRNNLFYNEFGEDAMITNLEIPEKTHIKLIERKSQIQSERLNLPIVKYEQEIMDQINHNLCTVVCGETGSGKSTQIPQFLYEYGYTSSFGAIAITQPRRVAAISLASRVAIEMNCKLADEVGYQIRYDSYHFSEKTVIKYLTDGILLKEIESDSFLLKYSVVIIDEAHERTINTDIIIGLLSQAVKLRYLLSKNKIKVNEKEVKPLRIVIMSATMRVDEFLESNVFNPKPAFIKVEARRFPVTVHHLKRTEMDYLDQAFKMTCKIHRKLPPGDVLVFLTGKQEILKLCEKLRKEFEENPEVINAGKEIVIEKNNHKNFGDNENFNKDIEEKEILENKRNLEHQNYLNKEVSNNQENNVDTGFLKNEFETNNQTETAIEEHKNKISVEKITQNLEGIEVLKDAINKCDKRPEDLIIENDDLDNFDSNPQKDENSEIDLEENKAKFTYKPAIVLPLFSSLTKEQQMKIFQKLDPNSRLIVVSTNIAETSLTIPNIRYVVDSGKAKKRIFKAGLSFSSFKVEWISQASAEQRTGRAGRTCAGFCYRLYSNGLFSKMDKFTEPQIVSSPLDQTILYLKSLDVRDINKFPFLTKPEKEFVDKALRHLLLIGALDSKSKNLIKAKLAENELNKLGKSNEDQIKYDDDTDITEVGKLMIKFPIIPRLARILILSNKLNMITYGLILSSLLSIESLFDSELKYEKFNNLNAEKDDLLKEEIENSLNTHKKPEKKTPKSIRDILDDKLISLNSDPITLMNLILYFFISFDKNIPKASQDKDSKIQILNINNKHIENNFFQYNTNKEINKVIDLFCEKFCLNNKKFKEMLDLLEQLIRISSQIFKKDAHEINLKIAKIPNKEEQITLSQILLSGYLDNIARKKIIYDKLSNEKEITTQKRLIYESNENNEEIHIHPFSVAFRSNLKSANVGNNLASPEYVIYKEIIKENKIFMNINTIIKPEWLYDIGGDLVKYSLNLSNMLSEPYYDKNNDAIYCYINMKYGYKSWEIPNILVEMRKTDDNYFRYFAKLLLEGKIFESLKKPSILTKQVSILPCVTMLLNELRINNILSKQDIFNKWKINKKFLLESILKWMSDDKAKKELIKIWPLQF